MSAFVFILYEPSVFTLGNLEKCDQIFPVEKNHTFLKSFQEGKNQGIVSHFADLEYLKVTKLKL